MNRRVLRALQSCRDGLPRLSVLTCCTVFPLDPTGSRSPDCRSWSCLQAVQSDQCVLPNLRPTRLFWVSRSHSLGLPPGLLIRSLPPARRSLSSMSIRLPAPSSAEGGLSECYPSFSVAPSHPSDLRSPRLRLSGFPDRRRRDCLHRPAELSWRERVLTLFHPRAQGVWQKFF